MRYSQDVFLFFNDDLFPNLDIDFTVSIDLGGFIVLPSYIKQANYPKMVDLWVDASLKLRERDNIIIIGLSFRKEDFMLNYLLSFCKRGANIFIIDENAEEIKNRLRDSLPLGGRTIKTYAKKIETGGFDEFREDYDKKC